MPKKFQGENSKSVVAKARKDAVETEKKERLEKAKEDALWADDDKLAQRKQQRKAEQEQKRLQTLEKKTLTKQAYEEEMSKLPSKPVASTTTKITQATIDARKQAEQAQRLANQKQQELEAKKIEVPEEDIEENLNRVNLDSHIASTVDEAIVVLAADSTPSSVDRHPEKRMKAAYSAFEERRLPQLKQEHPTFRLSKLKEMLRKEWQKSTENPLNQNTLSNVQYKQLLT